MTRNRMGKRADYQGYIGRQVRTVYGNLIEISGATPVAIYHARGWYHPSRILWGTAEPLRSAK